MKKIESLNFLGSETLKATNETENPKKIKKKISIFYVHITIPLTK